MARKLGTFKGTETGLPQKFADDTVIVSRVGAFSSFTDNDDTSYNIARGSNTGSTSTWDNNNVLIHSIRIVNTADDASTTSGHPAVVYFYQDDDTTNANARNATNLQFYLAVACTNQDVACNVLDIEFPIPLLIRKGCRITSQIAGPIVNISYTILNSTTTAEYNSMKQKYLTGTSLNSTTATAIHPNLGTVENDIEIFGGVCYNRSTTNDDYNSGFVTSTGESDLRKLTLSANENASGNAGLSGQYSPMFWPYPVICKAGAKLDCDDSETYLTIFYRERNSQSIDTEGWV